MNPETIVTNSVAETIALGRRIGAELRPGTVIALIGPLGAGKTQLVKGIAAGNGLPDPSAVVSPTFVLAAEYEGRVPLVHIDLYRLPEPVDLSTLGVDEMLRDGKAVVIEWADRAEGQLPKRVTITLSHAGESTRRIMIEGLMTSS